MQMASVKPEPPPHCPATWPSSKRTQLGDQDLADGAGPRAAPLSGSSYICASKKSDQSSRARWGEGQQGIDSIHPLEGRQTSEVKWERALT